MTQRLNPKDRRAELLRAAVNVAFLGCYASMTREEVAREAGASAALVTHYFGSMTKLRRAVMREAVARNIADIVAAGIARKDPLALAAPPTLKRKALRLLTAH